MAQGRTPQELEQIAMNLCQNSGIDMQSAMQQFQQFRNQFFGGNP